MLNTKLLYKSLKLSSLSGITIPACFIMLGVVLLLETIIGMSYDGAWLFGLYLVIVIVVVNMILFVWGLFGGRQLYKSEEWQELERAAKRAAEAAGAADPGSTDMSTGKKAALAAGAATAAGGRAASAAGSLAGNDNLKGAGDAASVAGGVVMAASMYLNSRSQRQHIIAMMDLLGVEHKAMHISRNLILIETVIMVAFFIPAFFTSRNEYIEASGALQNLCDEITGDLDDTGILSETRSSVYKDDYATIHAYLDEERYCYVIIDVEKDGTISELSYRLEFPGAENDAVPLAAEANEAFSQIYTALGETSIADTNLYLYFEIDEEIAAYVSDDNCYRVTNEDDVEIRCSYGYGEYDDGPYFYVWIE